MDSGIYQIKCIVTDKVYVGSAVHIPKRWRTHRSDMNLNKSKNRHLQNTWNKYGENVFEFSVLEYVYDKEMLISREQFWIDTLNAVAEGYNLAPHAGNCIGIRHPKETRIRMSKSQSHEQRSMQAKKGHEKTTWKEKSAWIKRGRASMSEEAKTQMIAKRLATLTPERRSEIARRIAATKRENGFVVSHETRNKQSKALQLSASLRTAEQRQAIAKKSASKFSSERRKIAGIAWQAKKTPEQRSESARRAWITRCAIKSTAGQTPKDRWERKIYCTPMQITPMP